VSWAGGVVMSVLHRGSRRRSTSGNVMFAEGSRRFRFAVLRARATDGAGSRFDVGCGEGELARHLPAGAWVGVDTSAEMLARAPEPHHLADATALPFPGERFGSVALLYVLYHLPDPAAALAEAGRVLETGRLAGAHPRRAAPRREQERRASQSRARGRLPFVRRSSERGTGLGVGVHRLRAWIT
jgi:SAM-dependent methyltransferase